MREVHLDFLEQAFVYRKEADQWQLTLKRSDVASQTLEELVLLDLHHPLFLEQKTAFDDDEIVFTYGLPADGLSYEAAKKRLMSERLRLALNLLDLEQALSLPVTFFLHPENLFITKDQQFKIAYRGLPEIMVPAQMDEADFVKQAKCFIISLFTKYDFLSLYNGALEVAELPDFLKALRPLETAAELRSELETSYRQRLEQEANSLVLVNKSRHKLYKYASIWLTAGMVMLLLPLAYLVFVRNPFKEKMLEADTAFIKVDYSGVIDKLKDVDVAALPYTQKYELAYAYIQVLKLSDEQRQIILNNVSLKSDELYLDYWIESGRERNDEAIDIAKRLDDSDLIIYGLVQKIREVRNDDSLSGSEREEELASLQSEYEKYWEDRQTSLNDGDDAKAASGESASSQTASAEEE
ncbi:type VII secretion protein EssB [Streptococcus chenjunshii]|uniref:Type VII secretion protein EssB n=1 Tax=Streptococcus chenjunshii TaxID=2173853 RepID=A0A372KIZ8_9STRE|nr:type VII secretion protein EssB [Streptococcus chenjunshii]AXQ79544.1 type VII secretion protein EssB [Streptococcus chenjunshii]RFU51459.1 type VII secretion protein EssB [Streptococcus chenjunshii]RFU52233.1 type VII secretion protein EssB [Streptococcus chenjunshii]